MLKKYSIFALSIWLMGYAFALSAPRGSNLDGRVQTLVYNQQDVFKINARIGTSTLIQLEQDERLEGDAIGLGLGDAKAWSLAVKGNNIFLKPIAGSADTNMILVTNKRSYAFVLSTQRKKHEADSFVVRFTYPDTALAKQTELEKKRERAKTMARKDNKLNMMFFMYGDTALAPTAAWDDGRFTYFEYDTNREIPAVFKATEEGEALVNSHIEGHTIVIHDTAKQFVLRMGKSVLAIDNDAYDLDGPGRASVGGSSMDGMVRLTKEGK